MKKLSLIALIILIVIQFLLPAKMIHGRELILQKGEVFRFKTRPIDPTDPFQGRYVWLGFENDFVPANKNFHTNINTGARIFASIKTGDDGFAHFSHITLNKPNEGNYLQTRYRGKKTSWNRETKSSIHLGARIDIPFDRFYMEEAKAPRAEQIVRDSTSSSNCWVNIRILNGKAAIEDVFVEGQSIRDLATKKEYDLSLPR